jgi:hypothetical protein
MPLADAPLAAAALRGKAALLEGGAPAPHAALAAALLAAKAEASAAQERVRAAALAWERERTAADALARQVAEAERFMLGPSGHPPLFTEHGASFSSRPAPAAPETGSRPDPTDPMVAYLHLQAAAVPHIKNLVTVVLDSTSTSYARWRDQMLLALRRYVLDDHVLLDTLLTARDAAWLRLDSVVMSWIFGTLSLDLQDVVRTPGGTARQAWLALEGQFLGNAEARAIQLDAAFRHFEQGDLPIGEYCRQMKTKADALRDLGYPVHDRVLVLNVLRGLNARFAHLRT